MDVLRNGDCRRFNILDAELMGFLQDGRYFKRIDANIDEKINRRKIINKGFCEFLVVFG
jgi:hypothetical protein